MSGKPEIRKSPVTIDLKNDEKITHGVRVVSQLINHGVTVHIKKPILSR